MQLAELKQRLKRLEALGFVPTERSGPTGVGHTLERQIGVDENNLPIPDIGGRVELKATRHSTESLITLFTFNKGAWKTKQADAIKTFGGKDHKGRQSLYSTVNALEQNSRGLMLALPEGESTVLVTHVPSGSTVVSYDLYKIVGKFMSKFDRLLFVQADSRGKGAAEEFHFNSAALLSDPGSTPFRTGFLDGRIMIDIRMHLKETGAVRNHGTGFRVSEQDLPSLFGSSQDLLA